ncbi:DNA polymerase III subunit alpha [Nonomuraea glycinis]|uniref:DNA polymerase III subunit alpha n=1 Tax=Nonomuraea glycinis TaxID=2047744 RepID=A0A918A2Y8_9ACTN|nr:DNA polymerase III subunit alpha [Nonomuraea glycinis]MCA2175734.1 DNA polymerase III subunit alpha [Nonomuraea glycinis]GGP05285.1 DNA-directed DNA polymerase [Nonomuraea glycinis]
MSKSFVHLHVHTEYSMLDGAAKMKPLFKEAERLEMPAIAMSDHGNMFGAYEFQKVAKGSPVKPIIGIEAYVAPENRFVKKPVFWGRRAETGVADGEGGKDVSGGGRFTHMTMWAKDADGLRNLFRLSSLASFEGYYSKPRMDQELVAQHASGIIATTGCPSGAVQTRLRLGQYDEAVRVAGEYQEIFGKENYFLELMDHGIDIEREVRADLLRLAKQLSIPLLVTNDSHYVTEDQADAHDSLLCVGVGKNKDDPNRFRFNGSGYYLKSADEMYALFTELPEACDNTLLVAEMVGDYTEVFGEVNRMPDYPDVPEGETQESWLRKEVERGLELRYGTPVPAEVLERYETEMKVIGPMGFSSYFLVVADICQYARDNGIAVGPGRGSATGSIVAYATRITELCPLEHGLLFERFLNPERINPPDIDLDFDDRQRDRMVAYVTEKYGNEYTAQVNTFGTIKAKAAVKDASRILGYPFAVGDKITKAMPPDVMGKGVPLADMFNEDHPRYNEGGEIRALYENDPDVHKVIDTGRGIEGLIRGTGVHAAAVILSSAPLLDLIPMHRRDKDGVIITGFDYPSCEDMGLVKMDFLGLRNLGIIDHAIKIIEQNRGIKLDTLTLPLDDATTYQLMARGDTLGVFQLDGGPMRQLLKLMEPTRFEDIAAVLALYRPGPMAANAHTNYAHRKNARQDIEPIHPELKEALEPILGTTFHLLVYQEQIMAVARELAGYTLGGADMLRRAMGKKKKEVLDAEWGKFSAGMRANGYSDESIQALWDVMLPFSGYAFNKSHTAGYGLVAYWTAYLKANYPAEYMAALLTSVGDDKDKAAIYLAECRKMGIQVLAPDVNESQLDFVAVGDDKVRFGLGAVRNVGANVVEGVVKARKEKGRYTDFDDFLGKVPLPVCNKRVIESLIKAGAFDSLEHPRKGLLMIHEQAVESVIDIKKNEAHGQDSLFGGADDADEDTAFTVAIPDMEWDKKTKLDFEREMLGLYVSDHPLAGAERLLARNRDTAIADLLDSGRDDRGDVTVCGMIANVDKRVNKAGNVWAIVTVEDMDAAVECLFFPKSHELYGPELRKDAVVSVHGQINNRDGAISVFAQDLTPIDVSGITSDAGHPVTLKLREERINPQVIEELRNVLKLHQGQVPLLINLRRIAGNTIVLALPEFQVNPEPSFAADIKQLFGSEAIAL